MRTLVTTVALLALTACGGGASPRPQAAVGRAPVIASPPAGLEAVVGQDAAHLVGLFGKPNAEFREGTARKLQFAGPICVLDAYLYPKSAAEPRVTWLDARQPDGGPMDRASCVAALTHARQ